MYWSSAPASVDNILIYCFAIEHLQVLLQYIPHIASPLVGICVLGPTRAHRASTGQRFRAIFCIGTQAVGVRVRSPTAPNRAETFPPRKRVIFHDGRAIFLELVDLRGAVLHVLADLKR